MKDVFISYNHQDKHVKDELAKIFDEAEITYFTDVNDLPLGEDIEIHLKKHLRETKFTVMIVSKNSLFSTWVGMEAINRLQQDIFNQTTSFLPILLDKAILDKRFPVEMAKEFKTKQTELEELRDELKSLGRNTEIYDVDINRIAKVDILAILQKIKNSRMVDFTNETRKAKEIEKLLNTIKPERIKPLVETKEINKQQKFSIIKKETPATKVTFRKKQIETPKEQIKFQEKQKEIEEKQKKIPKKQIEIEEKPKIITSAHQDFIEEINGVEFKMIFVEEGTFMMGSDHFEDTKPIHLVTLNSFYLAETLVTQELWEKVMGSNPSEFKNNYTSLSGYKARHIYHIPRNNLQCPVERVSWEDTQNFIQKLNQLTGKIYGLPTEAQWEYAARGGNESKGYQYAGSNKHEEVAWCKMSETHPVKTKKPNELGLYDMSGNVWEWCSDWYDDKFYKKGNKSINPENQTKNTNNTKVLRGGSWHSEYYCVRVVYRSYGDFIFRKTNNFGFRVCLKI